MALFLSYVVTKGERSRCLAWPSDGDSWLVGIDEVELSSPFIRRWGGHIRRTHTQEEAAVDAALQRSCGSVAFLVMQPPCAAAENL